MLVLKSKYKQLEIEYSVLRCMVDHLLSSIEVYKERAINLELELERERLFGARSRSTSSVLSNFDDKEIKTLLSLCHPDKHDGKESAVRMTQKLLELR
jgi:hypothetical protein